MRFPMPIRQRDELSTAGLNCHDLAAVLTFAHFCDNGFG